MVWGVVPLLRMRSGQRAVNETQTNSGAARWLVVMIVMLLAAVGCSPSPAPTAASNPPSTMWRCGFVWLDRGLRGHLGDTALSAWEMPACRSLRRYRRTVSDRR
jgi:hypothetical protein